MALAGRAFILPQTRSGILTTSLPSRNSPRAPPALLTRTRVRLCVNILDFAEPSDFLLALFRDPLVAVATVVPIVLVGWYLKASERRGENIRQRWRAAGVPIAWWETKEKNVEVVRQQMIWVRGATILLWVFASGAWYERCAADHGRRW